MRLYTHPDNSAATRLTRGATEQGEVTQDGQEREQVVKSEGEKIVKHLLCAGRVGGPAGLMYGSNRQVTSNLCAPLLLSVGWMRNLSFLNG